MALYLGNQKVAPTMLPSSGGLSIPLEVSSNGELQKPTTPFTWSLPSNATNLHSYVLAFAFQGCTGITSADLSSVITANTHAMYQAFNNCTSLTSVDLSNLTTLNGDNHLYFAFSICTSLRSVDLSSLATMAGEYVMQSAFYGCTSLATLSFPSLNSNSFGSRYTNQFNSMLSDVTGCTVHFPSNLQSVIGSWSSVTSGFGGTNTTVLFDLPATT